MFLDIHDLELRRVFFDESLAPGKIDFGRGISQVEPLEARGSAELLVSEIHLKGALHTVVEVCCDRCLEPTRHDVSMDFDLFYSPMSTIAKNEEVEIRREDLDIGFYQGNGLLLEDALKEQILLALPMKNICRESCAGLCPKCGKNLNLGDCGCATEPTDLRWAGLRKLDLPSRGPAGR